MKLRMKVLISLFVIGIASLSTSAKEWRGLTPLRSTRADVDRIIGSKVVTCGRRSCLYDLGDETVFVLYADEPTCANDDATTSWKVPRGTVIEISVRFKTDRKLSELGFDLEKFERAEDKEVLGWVYYNNPAEGVEIEGNDTTASGVNYFQSANDNHLRCPSSKPRRIGRSQQPTFAPPLTDNLLHRLEVWAVPLKPIAPAPKTNS